MQQPSAIMQALERRNWAADELEAMTTAREYGSFHRHWSAFLLHFNGALEKIGRVSGEMEKPAKEISRLRVADPMLLFLKEARNETEHGLSQSTEQAYHAVVVPGIMRVLNVEFPDANTAHFRVNRTGFWIYEEVPGERILGFAADVRLTGQLRPVPFSSRSKGRGPNDLVPVPQSHLGETIPLSNAFTISELALSFLDAALARLGITASLQSPKPKRVPVPIADRIEAFSLDQAAVVLTLRNEQGVSIEKRLEADELEALIEHLSDLRSKLEPSVPNDFVPGVAATVMIDPRWLVMRNPTEADHPQVIAFRHPGLGWIVAKMPDPEAKNLSQWANPDRLGCA